MSKKNSKPTPYRDEKGVRINTYRRFKEGVHYQAIEPNEMGVIIAMAQGEGKELVKKRTGRPALFDTPEELEEAIQAYFDYIIEANDKYQIQLIPDIEGMACFIGTDRETMFKWEQNNLNGLSNTVKRAKNIIAACKKQLALRGKIPPIVFATDMNNNHGYTQKQEVVITPQNDNINPEALLSEIENLPEITDGN